MKIVIIKKTHFLISLLLCGSAALLFYSAVLAQTPIEILETEATPAATQVDDKKIQEIRDQVREKVQEKIEEIRERGTKRGYVGQIEAINNLEIILSTRGGERKITIDEDTKIIGRGRQNLESENLQVGDVIIAMGYVNSTGEMVAKRIVVVPKPAKPPLTRRAVYGRVAEIEPDSQILIIVHPKKEEVIYQVKITNKTRMNKKIDGKMQTIKFSDIEVDDRIATVGTWDEDNELLTAKLLHVIPLKN